MFIDSTVIASLLKKLKLTKKGFKTYLRMQRRKRVGCLRKEKTKVCEREEKRVSEQRGTDSVLLHPLFGQLPVR